MGDTPDVDDTELRAWFHQQLDRLTPESQPFDRRRFHEDTLPREQKRPPRHSSPWLILAPAAAVATLALALGGHAGLGSVVGSPTKQAESLAPTATHHAAARFGAVQGTVVQMAELAFLSPKALPPASVLEPVATAANAATGPAIPPVMRAAPPALPVSLLRSAQVVRPGGYRCPAPKSAPVSRAFADGAKTVTLTAFQGGCPWFYLTPGLRDTLASPLLWRQAMAAHRLYYVPRRLAAYLGRSG
jgi:hypothetical protein